MYYKKSFIVKNLPAGLISNTLALSACKSEVEDGLRRPKCLASSSKRCRILLNDDVLVCLSNVDVVAEGNAGDPRPLNGLKSALVPE